MSPAESTPSPEGAERGVSRRTLELGFAGLLIVLAGLTLVDSFDRGAGWGADGPQGGYFPARVGGVMLLGSIAVFWSGLKASRATVISHGQMTSVLKILVPLAVHIALIEPLGIYIPSALLIMTQMRMFGTFRWWQLLLGGVLTMAIIFYVFEVQFMVPLPKGPFEAWLGY